MLNAVFVPKVQWTDELIEKGRALVASGHSYEKAAKELGITKGALIGKLCRLGIKPERGRPLIRVTNPPKYRAPRTVTRIAPRIDPIPSNEPEPLRVPFMEAGPFHCRNVLDGELGLDGRAMFCGLPTIGETSYCAYHKSRFSVPARR